MMTVVFSADKRYFFVEELAKQLGSQGFWQPTHPEEDDECLPFQFWKMDRGEVKQVDDDSGIVESYRKAACIRCPLGRDGVCIEP